MENIIYDAETHRMYNVKVKQYFQLHNSR